MGDFNPLIIRSLLTYRLMTDLRLINLLTYRLMTDLRPFKTRIPY